MEHMLQGLCGVDAPA